MTALAFQKFAFNASAVRTLLAALALLSALTGAAAQQAWTGVVSRVVDGDTVHVTPGPGVKARKVRILGIDAPERCQPHGPNATQALKSLAQGRTVLVSSSKRDDYGRDLGVVYVLNGPARQDLGQQMVLDGHAWSYRFKQDPGPYAAQERQARHNKLGLFADSAAEYPGQFRRRHGSCDAPARRH